METSNFAVKGMTICTVIIAVIAGFVFIVCEANLSRAKGIENRRIAEEEYAEGIENGYKVFIDGIETTALVVVNHSKQLVSVNVERKEIDITTKVVDDHTLTAMLTAISGIGLIGGGVAMMYATIRGY